MRGVGLEGVRADIAMMQTPDGNGGLHPKETAAIVSWLREHTSLPLHKRDGVRPRRPVFERGLRRLLAQ